MRRQKIDLSPERHIITNMIVSDSFLKSIMPIFRPQLLKTGYAKEVAAWITEYYTQYKTAPGKDIQSIYQQKKKQLPDEETADNVAEFLKRLSEDYEQSEVNNVQYEIKQAIHYLKTRSLEILKEQIEASLESDNPIKGEQALTKYTRVEPPMGEGTSILRDAGKVASAFMSEDFSLFAFPGAFGKVVGKLRRADFMAFMAPMKRGKTFYLWHTAETAMVNGLRVIFFTLEMSEDQMNRRAWQSLVGQPEENMEIALPYFEENEDGKFEVHQKKTSRKAIDPSKIESLQKRLNRQFRPGDVRIISFPAYSVTVEGIEAYIDNLEYYDKYIPDVIIIDYADIIKPSSYADYRHQLDMIWKSLRRIAQERSCLVVTATQSEKKTFESDAKESSVAEDIRKLAHVTCMVALNQKKKEAEQGIMRVSQIALREGRRQFQQAVVLGCLDIGRPVLDSRLEKDVYFEDKKEEKKKGKGGRE